jgi:hypothetical protein
MRPRFYDSWIRKRPSAITGQKTPTTLLRGARKAAFPVPNRTAAEATIHADIL